uniref:Ladinin-1 n=1 Tax=Sus scrofa TaxID=9823 RepID=A0A8D1AHE0_PIG
MSLPLPTPREGPHIPYWGPRRSPAQCPPPVGGTLAMWEPVLIVLAVGAGALLCRTDHPLPSPSSLARQWTLEDEEEQERERRRRHRNLSSTTDDEAAPPALDADPPAPERLPSVEEAEIPQQPPPPDSKDENEDVRTVVRTRQERRQRQRLVEAAQAPVREQLEAEQGDSEGAGQAGQRPLVPRKEVELPPHRTLSRERWGSGAREEESAGKEPSGGRKWGSEKPAAPGKTCPERSPDSEEVSVSERSPGPEKVSVLEKIAVLEKRTVSGKRSVSEKASISEKLPAPGKTRGSEKRLVSEKAAVFEKPMASGAESAPTRAAASGQAQEQPASGKSPSITQGQRRARPEEQPASPASEPRAVAGRLPPITLQVKIPSREDEVDTSSPTGATYSSSLRRSSPRTISFRMSPKRDISEAALTRSASMRLPASSVSLGQKLERYHTAIQRSESVKYPGSTRTEFLVAPVDVARKRHLFEKELAGQGREEPMSSRKEDLKLSGVVTSRLNLWISRTQESGDRDPQVPCPSRGLSPRALGGRVITAEEPFWEWGWLWRSLRVRRQQRGGSGVLPQEGEGPGGPESLACHCRPEPLVSAQMPTTRRYRKSRPLPGGPSGERKQIPPWMPRCGAGGLPWGDAHAHPCTPPGLRLHSPALRQACPNLQNTGRTFCWLLPLAV